MKIRPSILLGGIAVLVALCAILWLSKTPQVSVIVADSPVARANPDEVSSMPVQPVAAARQLQSAPADGDVPIMFYGRLEDQAGQPVTQADILGTTVFHKDAARRAARFSTKSDADGRFQIEAGMGESLELAPHKEGYALASTSNTAFYGSSNPEQQRHHPDPNEPVIIKMWKLQGAEPLAAFDGRFSLSVAQSPVHFDFVAQTLCSTNGDIRISINPPATTGASDWSIEIETEGAGGLMPVTASQWSTTYWAPTDGYETRQVIRVSTNAQWSQEANALFFVQSRHGGVYTKVKIRGFLDGNAALDFELSGISNTNGSCNWEGDPGTLRQD
jgi:hypothetical protein